MDRTLVIAGVLVAVVLVATLLRSRPRAETPRRVEPAEVGLASGSGVGVVGFSSPYCVPCREWERALDHAGIAFAKVDVSERPELVNRYGIRSAPLVLAVRLPAGEVVERFQAAPRPDQVERLRGLVASHA